MSGKKSIDQIWQQMQAQRAAESQRQAAQERAINEQRELARQEYLRRMRMFEASNSISPSSAAAGAGGGRKFREVLDFDTITAEHFVLSWVDLNDTWQIVVHNFKTGETSDIISTGLTHDSGNEWYIDSDEFAVSEKGHAIVFFNNNSNKYKIVFVNSNGQLIAIKDIDTREDFQYTENAQIFLGELDGVSTCYHFDGANVRTHTFPGVDISDIEVDDASEDDVTRDGSIIIEAPNNLKYFISKPDGRLIDISNHMTGLTNFRIDYNTDYIFKIDEDLDIKIISQDGELKNTFDLTSYSTTFTDISSLYGDNCAFSILNTSQGYNLLVSYDGDSNEFVSFTFSNSYNVGYYENSWYSPNPSFGKTLNFYQYTNIVSDTIGNIATDLEYYWLPKGETSFLTHSFGSATVSLIDGTSNWTSDRIFSLGENPITMYAYGDGPIIVGFLTSTGFITQSTGIQYASCSNIWGKPIGQNSFAVFDVDYTTDRIWQIYGENSIISQTTTTQDWYWGTSDMSVHRNGTLVIQDSGDASASNTFIYTSEIGMTSGPTGLGTIINSVESGNRTGLSTEYQVIIRYVEGEEFNEYIKGFYLVSKSGLSNFIDCFPGLSPSSTYTLSQSKLNSELLTLHFVDSQTSNVRVQNYKIPTLELIDDWDPMQDSSNITIRLFKNRCLIIDNNSGTSIRFVGNKGVKTMEINGTNLNTEANDTWDNN